MEEAGVGEGAVVGEGSAGEDEFVAGLSGHDAVGDDVDGVLEDVGGGVGVVVVAGEGSGVGDGGSGDVDGSVVGDVFR